MMKANRSSMNVLSAWRAAGGRAGRAGQPDAPRARRRARARPLGFAHLVAERLPGHVRRALQLVVDEELRRLLREPKAVDRGDERAEQPRVPALVRRVADRVGARARHERQQRPRDVLGGLRVVGRRGRVRKTAARGEGQARQPRAPPGERDGADLVRLPELDGEAHARRHEDHVGRVVVEQVEEGDRAHLRCAGSAGQRMRCAWRL